MDRRRFLASGSSALLLRPSRGGAEAPKNPRRNKGAEIRSLGGVPTLFVDGVAKGPMAFRIGESDRTKASPAQLKILADAGIEIFLPMVATGDPARAAATMAELDREVAYILDAVPSARIMPWLKIFPYAEFATKFPDEVITFDDGAKGPYTSPGMMRLSDPKTPRYTFASESWKRETAGLLGQVVQHVNSAAYSDRIIGYFLFALCYEWSYFWDWDKENRAIDYSPAMLRLFRAWTRKQYGGDVRALRRAWKDENVRFETLQLPSKEDKNRTDFGWFWSPDASQRVIDYFRCHADAVADKLIHFSKLIRRESRGRVVTGAFYGYLQNQDYIYGGQARFKQVLRTEELGYWCSPFTYENKGPGDHPSARFLLKTLKDHGRLWFAECDTFMHDTAKGALRHHGYPQTTAEQSIEVIKRDFSYVLCEGMQAWWVDWSQGPSFYKEPVISMLARMQKIGRAALGFPRGSATDIAAVVDEESILTTPCLKARRTTKLTLDRLKVHELPRIGSPVDYYELDDVLRSGAKRYKMYIFLNPFCIDNNERRLMMARLKRDGNTLVWIYGPGFINPDAPKTLSLAHMRDLTGMSFDCIADERRARIKVDNHGDPITSGLQKGTEFGDFDRPLTSGFEIDKETMAPVALPPMTVSPLFHVDDPQATVLGTYVESGKVGFAVRRFKTWTSVYVGSLAVGSHILRAIAQAAGAHLYDDTDQIVYANESFLAIHTSKAGKRTLRLRRRSDVYEPFEDRVLAKDVDAFTIEVPAHATRLFFLGDANELKPTLDGA